MRSRTRHAGCGLALALATAAIAPSTASAEPAVAVLPGNVLSFFDTTTPGTRTPVGVTGLGAGETLEEVDLRPWTYELFGVSMPTGVVASALVKTYRIDPATGAATLIGSIPNTVPGAGDRAGDIDFDPRVDRIRYVQVNDENFRINPNNGALSGDDANLTPANSQVIGAAYDRNNKDNEARTLFAIARNGSKLVRQGGVDANPSANNGVLTDIGPLGVTLSATADGGFDIAESGVAYAALRTSDNVTRLYTVNPGTGAATLVGTMGDGTFEVKSLTILTPNPAPPPPQSPGPDTTPPIGLVSVEPSMRASTFLKSGLRASFSCSEVCTANTTLGFDKGYLSPGIVASLTKAGVGKLKLEPSSKARKMLPKGRTVKAKLITVLTDLAGNPTTVTRTVRLLK